MSKMNFRKIVLFIFAFFKILDITITVIGFKKGYGVLEGNPFGIYFLIVFNIIVFFVLYWLLKSDNVFNNYILTSSILWLSLIRLYCFINWFIVLTNTAKAEQAVSYASSVTSTAKSLMMTKYFFFYFYVPLAITIILFFIMKSKYKFVKK